MSGKSRARWIWLGLAVLVGIPAVVLAADLLQIWWVMGRMH